MPKSISLHIMLYSSCHTWGKPILVAFAGYRGNVHSEFLSYFQKTQLSVIVPLLKHREEYQPFFADFCVQTYCYNIKCIWVYHSLDMDFLLPDCLCTDSEDSKGLWLRLPFWNMSNGEWCSHLQVSVSLQWG
jgi:hypothetical protein